MSDDPVLTEEEVDTLLDGVENGDVETEAAGADAIPGEVVPFDFRQEHNILVSRMPKLGTLNDKLVKALMERFLEVYKTEVEVKLAFLHTSRFDEFRAGLPTPSNMHLISVNPGQVNGMVVLDPKLLYILVDHYFGGSGDTSGRQPTPVFSPIEIKMGEQFLAHVIREWEQVWAEVLPLSFAVIGREDKPALVQNIAPNEVMFQAVFQVGFSGHFGECHVVIPYSVIESVKEVLGSDGPTDDPRSDAVWQARLAEEVGAATVGISSSIEGLKLTLRQLIELSPGDVVPLEMPETISLMVEEVPVFEGFFGAFDGKNAVKIKGPYLYNKPRKLVSKP